MPNTPAVHLTIVEAVARALEQAAGWFDEYAAAHRAKDTPDGNIKAATNSARAGDCRRAIRAALAVQPSLDTRPHMHGCTLPKDHTGTCERPSNTGPSIADLKPGHVLTCDDEGGYGLIKVDDVIFVGERIGGRASFMGTLVKSWPAGGKE